MEYKASENRYDKMEYRNCGESGLKLPAVSLGLWHNLPDYFLNDWDTPTHMPDTIGTGSYEQYFEHVKYLKENYDVYVIAAIWGSHWEKAYFARGIENFLADLAASPEWSQELLDLII